MWDDLCLKRHKKCDSIEFLGTPVPFITMEHYWLLGGLFGGFLSTWIEPGAVWRLFLGLWQFCFRVVLGSAVFFNNYMEALGKTTWRFGLRCHWYSNDAQI